MGFLGDAMSISAVSNVQAYAPPVATPAPSAPAASTADTQEDQAQPTTAAIYTAVDNVNASTLRGSTVNITA